jgi:hypothetical protein
VHSGLNINRPAVAPRWLEFHLLHSTGGQLVEAVSEAAHDAYNSYLARGAEFHLEQEFAFEASARASSE